jgi:8-oxo-dGTP diphosphatase
VQAPGERRLVVGGIIVDSLSHPTRVVAARRSRPAALAGGWEFPGGKVEEGESPQDALVRELREELGVTVEVGDELGRAEAAWRISASLELRLFLVRVTSGEHIPGESHDRIQHLDAESLTTVRWLPADEAGLPALRARLIGPA